MKTKTLLIATLFYCTYLSAQIPQTLYLEDFNDDYAKGVIDDVSDITDIDWTIDVSGATFSNGFDYFICRDESFVGTGDIFLEARDVDGPVIWLSPVIVISGYTDVEFTIDASESGTLESSDTVITEYRIDTGAWTVASINGSIADDFNSAVVGETGLSGSTLELRVTITNSASAERHRIDNISVTGILDCTMPVNPAIFTASNGGNTSILLDWDLHVCNDEYLIIAKNGSAVTAVPTGDGSSYVANSEFGSGTEIAINEFVVYKGTLNNEVITNLILDNNYHFTIFSRFGTTWSTGTEIDYIDYCTAEGTRDDYDTNISGVAFGSIDNNTALDNNGAGYNDYTAKFTSLSIGDSEALSVRLDTDGDWENYCYVWIDWNRDGDFEDAGETYDLGFTDNEIYGLTSNSPISITVPNNAEVGNTRMRVLSQYYDSFDDGIPTNGPCEGSDDGEVEDYTITILPAPEYTYDNAWSPSDPNGITTSINNITIASGIANFDTNSSFNNITVKPEGSLKIENGVTLAIDGDMILESNSTRYASLISNGTITGDVLYKRHVNNAAASGTTTTANDLISAPLTDQTFGDFRAANPNILSGTIEGNPAFLFGPFNAVNGVYDNYSPSDDASTLGAGMGYRTGSTDGTTYTFTGTIETGTVNTAVVSGDISNWNLIGNPYPSYLKVQDFLNNTSNRNLLDESSFGIYGYDGTAADGWVIYNLATTTDSTVITPGQGFFVNAEASGNMQFTPAMRAEGTDDDFIAGRNNDLLVYLKLNIYNATDNYTSDFYFNDNASLSLDPGYDASVWNDTPPSFSIYSHLVENNEGKAMAIQALHSDNLLDVTIPLGVNANDSSDLVFTISESTIPNTINVYLEDTLNNTSTLLTEEDYTLTLNSTLSGTGRFYLRFAANQLDISETTLETLNILTDNHKKSIVVLGLVQKQTSFQLFDIRGREVLNTVLQQKTNKQNIDASHLTSGIYVVKLKSHTGIKTKKIIISH